MSVSDGNGSSSSEEVEAMSVSDGNGSSGSSSSELTEFDGLGSTLPYWLMPALLGFLFGVLVMSSEWMLVSLLLFGFLLGNYFVRLGDYVQCCLPPSQFDVAVNEQVRFGFWWFWLTPALTLTFLVFLVVYGFWFAAASVPLGCFIGWKLANLSISNIKFVAQQSKPSLQRIRERQSRPSSNSH